MPIIINTTSMIPIYEQIVEDIKIMIKDGELKDGDPLPSIRILANELKISALTVKKAYDTLEEKGLAKTVHGKGTYISILDQAKIDEENRKELEDDIVSLLKKAERYHVDKEDIKMLFELMMEERS